METASAQKCFGVDAPDIIALAFSMIVRFTCSLVLFDCGVYGVVVSFWIPSPLRYSRNTCEVYSPPHLCEIAQSFSHAPLPLPPDSPETTAGLPLVLEDITMLIARPVVYN